MHCYLKRVLSEILSVGVGVGVRCPLSRTLSSPSPRSEDVGSGSDFFLKNRAVGDNVFKFFVFRENLTVVVGGTPLPIPAGLSIAGRKLPTPAPFQAAVSVRECGSCSGRIL